MLTFIQFLEELEKNNQAVVIPGDEVERLVERFGHTVRQMGVWNKATDGSVEIPMNQITEAVSSLGNKSLTEALEQLKTPVQFTDMLSRSSAAAQLIEALCRLHLEHFERRVLRFQESKDPAEVERLGDEISRELFGS